MDMFKTVKCVAALIKCSKCLYFVKKALCVVIILISCAAAFCLFLGDKKECKKLVSKIKAVM